MIFQIKKNMMKRPESIIGSRHINSPFMKYNELVFLIISVSYKKQSNETKLSDPSPIDDKSFKKLSN